MGQIAARGFGFGPVSTRVLVQRSSILREEADGIDVCAFYTATLHRRIYHFLRNPQGKYVFLVRQARRLWRPWWAVDHCPLMQTETV